MDKTFKKFFLTLGTIILIIVCSLFFSHSEYDKDVLATDLKIISSSENRVLETELLKYAESRGINITIEYADTLDIMDKINSGAEYDAVWSSNSIWLYLIDSNMATITNSKSMSINPVVFGIKKSKAEQLNFVGKEVYTNDIIQKIANKELRFAMSNPITTNSGASAYLGILSTLAGNPEVLTSDILNNPELKEKMKTFFLGIERTSGTEDFLEELFLKGDYEAVVAYESSIININKRLIKEGKEPLYAVYPVDGVSISDSVFAYIDHQNENKKNTFLSLQNYLLSSKGQKILENYGRRTWYGGINDEVDRKTFNPDWGIDTTKYVTPIKYPSTAVIKDSLGIYQIELRKPVHVVFCLDYSGSMNGEGIIELRKAMNYILSEQASDNYIQFSEKDKIDVVPFSNDVIDVWTTDNGINTDYIRTKINDSNPRGSTALYDAADRALNLLKNEDKDQYNVSVILMTDGLANIGTYQELATKYKSINQEIPIYSIMFGAADEGQLQKIALLTNGKVFDGKTDLVSAFKKVRGYN